MLWNTEQVAAHRLARAPVDTFHLREPHFQAVRARTKLVEGRLERDGRIGRLRPGDRLALARRPDADTPGVPSASPPAPVLAAVRGVAWYTRFADMLAHEGLAYCLPDERTIESGVRLYCRLYGLADDAALCVAAVRIHAFAATDAALDSSAFRCWLLRLISSLQHVQPSAAPTT